MKPFKKKYALYKNHWIVERSKCSDVYDETNCKYPSLYGYFFYHRGYQDKSTEIPHHVNSLIKESDNLEDLIDPTDFVIRDEKTNEIVLVATKLGNPQHIGYLITYAKNKSIAKQYAARYAYYNKRYNKVISYYQFDELNPLCILDVDYQIKWLKNRIKYLEDTKDESI